MINIENIIGYAFRGVPRGSDRSIITTIKTILVDSDVACPLSLDSDGAYYTVTGNTFNKSEYCVLIINDPEQFNLKIVDQLEYLYLLCGQKVDLQWYKNLLIGDTVKIGYVDSSNGYQIAFPVNKVRMYMGQEVTINDIMDWPMHGKKFVYYNNDERIYHIKEFDKYVPSCIFVPQFEPVTPIERITLQSFSIKNYDFLK